MKLTETGKVIELLFGKTAKSYLLREAALKLILLLRKKERTAEELYQAIGKKKTYYKVINRLKEFGIISAIRTKDRKLVYTLTPEVFKFYMRRLIEACCKELNLVR